MFELESAETPCTGLVFRAHANHYIDYGGSYVFKQGLKLLKRKSCKCQKCQVLLDTFQESVSNCIFPILPILVDGNLYGLRVINESRDWETGIIDDYDLEYYSLQGKQTTL